jgi:hypothetical protein
MMLLPFTWGFTCPCMLALNNLPCEAAVRWQGLLHAAADAAAHLSWRCHKVVANGAVHQADPAAAALEVQAAGRRVVGVALQAGYTRKGSSSNHE